MQTFVVSDDGQAAARVRQWLLHQGHACPPEHLVPVDGAAGSPAEAAEVAVVVMSPAPERSLAVLSEVRARTRARLLAVGPADSKLILRSGADEYLDEAELEVELEAALNRMRGEAPAAAGHLLAVVGPSGGSGASTLAVNVATVWAREHQKALLLDLKGSTGDLAALLDLAPAYTFGDLCQNVVRLDRNLFERLLTAHPSGVHLLASPRSLTAVRLTPEGVRQALNFGRSLFPYVVADLDHAFGDEEALVLRQADVILIVVRLDFTTLRNTRRVLEYLDQLGVARGRVRLVVNRHGQPHEVPLGKAEYALGVKVFHCVPDDPATVNRANNTGVPAVLDCPAAKVCKSLTQLAAGLNGHQSS